MITIETDRLRLRPHRAGDFPASAALWADPNVTRYISGRPFSQEESWARFLRYAGHWPLMGYGYWAIEEKCSGAFAGEAGFAEFKRDIEPSIDGMPELGWVLASSAHGKGYATEAVRVAIEWGRVHLPSKRIVCLIDPENVRSIRVADKCGFREFARGVYKQRPVLMFAQDLS